MAFDMSFFSFGIYNADEHWKEVEGNH